MCFDHLRHWLPDLEAAIAHCTELGFPPQRLGRIGEHLHNGGWWGREPYHLAASHDTEAQHYSTTLSIAAERAWTAAAPTLSEGVMPEVNDSADEPRQGCPVVAESEIAFGASHADPASPGLA